ncbi:MAG: hypothetical protein KDE27_12750 [Planctomycetes bacterium]|nr:hypothetical protein [Planctomycetota bacterium]
MATIAVAWLAQLAAAQGQQPLYVELANAQSRFRFDTGQGTLIEVEDLTTGKTIAIQNDVPWRVRLRPFGSVQLGPVVGPTATPVRQSTATTLTFAWQQQIDPFNTIIVAQHFDLPANGPHLRSRLEVYGDGQPHFGLPANSGTTTYAIHESRTYLTVDQDLTGGRNEDFALLSARGVFGVHSPTAVLQPPYTLLGPNRPSIPGVSLKWDDDDGLRESFNYNLFLGCYWYDDGSGICAYPERGSGHHPLLTGYRSLAGNRFQMAHVEKHSRDDTPGINAIAAVALRIAPYRTARTIEGWYEFAQTYRSYLDGLGFFARGRVTARADLSSHIRSGGLLLGWFGPDSDPSPYPYTNPTWRQSAVGIWSRSTTYVNATENVINFFIGWNRHANDPHSLYWPKPGQELFFQEIRATNLLRPMVYTLTNTINVSPVDPTYGTFSPYRARRIDGSLQQWSDDLYGTVDQLNPATWAWAAMIEPRLGALSSAYGVGGAYFDAPAPVEADYNPQPTNLTGPGEYQIGAVVDSLAYVRDSLKASDPNYLTITENAPEAFMHDMDLLGGDGQLPSLLPTIFDYVPSNNHLDKYLGGYQDLQSVLFNPTVYHHSVPLVGIGPFVPYSAGAPGPTAYWDLFQFHNARAALEGGAIPAMYEIGPYFAFGGLANHELATGDVDKPFYDIVSVQGPRYADIVADLLAYRRNSIYLIDGEWWPRPAYDSASVATPLVVPDYNCSNCSTVTSYRRPDVVASTWRSTQPGTTNWFGLYFFTSESTARTVNFSFDARRHGYAPGRTVKLYESTPTIRTLRQTGIDTVSFSKSLTVDRVAHFEIEVL